MHKPYIVVILFLIIVGLSNAQDSTKTKLTEKLELDLFGGGYYQAPLSGRRILRPTIIDAGRSPFIGGGPTTVTDHPLLHGAYYAGLHANLEVVDGLTFHADFIGEHRGFSYGTYNTKNMVLYPRAQFVLDKTFDFKGRPFNFYVNVGNKTNVRLYEGLMIYNLDAQGWDIHAQYGRFRLTYSQLSDMHRWIGLDIGDTYDLMLSLEEMKLTDQWNYDLKTGIYNYESYARLSDPTGLTFSFGAYDEKTRVYVQTAHRFNPNSNFGHKTALVLGASTTVKKDAWSVKGTAEYRFYGDDFNRGYINRSVSYRDGSRGPYANTIGDHLYPLSLYDRPFGQWAVFSEYQGMTVHGPSLNAHGKLFVYKELFVDAVLDANLMLTPNESAFLYPFYRLAFGWGPLEGNYCSLGITNKGMNLDVHYPTFYLYRRPYFHLTLKRVIHGG